jgi:hypothetical protein
MAQGTTRGVPIDIDPLLAANSDLLVPSQKAIKTYADTKISSVSATSPMVSTGGTSPTLSIPQATSSADGYLSSTDWTTFSNKQNALGFTPEDVANKQTNLTASATKYPTVNAVNTGLALKQNALGYTPYRFNAPAQIVHTGTTAETILQTILIPANTFTNGDFIMFSALVTKLANLGVTTHTLKVNTTNTLTGATLISTAGLNTTNFTMKFKREIALNGGNGYILNISNNIQNDQTINAAANLLPSFTYNLGADLYFFVTCTLTNVLDTITYRGLNLYKQ